MPQTEWKPGPPPLDKPGRYDCRWGVFGTRWLVEVTLAGTACNDDATASFCESELTTITAHFPIPDPPTETET